MTNDDANTVIQHNLAEARRKILRRLRELLSSPAGEINDLENSAWRRWAQEVYVLPEAAAFEDAAPRQCLIEQLNQFVSLSANIEQGTGSRSGDLRQKFDKMFVIVGDPGSGTEGLGYIIFFRALII